MRLSYLIASLLTPITLLATSYSPFSITNLHAHEPNGNPDGQVDYYNFEFTVSSTDDASGTETVVCSKTWSDNTWEQTQAYSMNVPTGSWIACEPADSFSFQLYPYFSIGNFTLGVQQNFTDPSTSSQLYGSGTTHLANTTSSASNPLLTCTIDPVSTQYTQHASGDCSLPAGTSLSLPISTTSPAPPCTANPVSVTFSVSADVNPTQTELFLSGNTTSLRVWDPDSAIELPLFANASASSTGWPVFKNSLSIPAGTGIEYKFLTHPRGELPGGYTWECCENRVYSVPTGTCGDVTEGGNPDIFRNPS